jgi:hypothetical protein
MTVPSGPGPTFQAGLALQDGSQLQKMADQLFSTKATVTAHSGGTKALALPITASFTEVSVVAAGGDSVILPKGYAGLEIILANSGASSMQVFGAGTDTINAVATGTGVAQANATTALYKCVEVTAAGVGRWFRILSA